MASRAVGKSKAGGGLQQATKAAGKSAASKATPGKTAAVAGAGRGGNVAAESAGGKVGSKRGGKGTGKSRKAGGTRGRRGVVGERVAVGADGVALLREWGSARECLEWLAADGFQLSTKNFYAHYGPASKIPVKRSADGLFHYPELLERIRLKRNAAAGIAPEEGNSVAHARAMAELRMKEAQASREELALALDRGRLMDRDAVMFAANRVAQAAEGRRKSLCATLPALLVGLPEREIHAVLSEKTSEMFGQLAKQLQDWSEAEVHDEPA